MGQPVRAGDLDIWTEQVGQGPDVLLIGGLGDTVESWQFQLDGLADRYRLTAFDNRGAGRTAMPDGRFRSRRWRTTPPRSSGRSAFPPPTSPASPGAASSPRSCPCGTPSWSAAWFCRAPGRCRTRTFAPGASSSTR
jgi:pimeloyl-ACP methyl ester carboxylesterase